MKITILSSLYFILPAYIANMAPVLLKWIPLGNYPLDRGKTWHGKRIFGENKTYRGILAGITGAVLAVYMQKFLSPFVKNIELMQYENFNALKIFAAGFLFGAGAMLGDLIKSFFKRRLGIKEGMPWIPFDQLDFVIGALAGISFFYIPSVAQLLAIFIATPVLHLSANILGYLLKLKKVWW